MRRILIAAVATSALVVPAIAVAHGSERSTTTEHHGARHAERHHRRHHHHARLIAFHAQAPATTTPSTGTGATPPTPVTAGRAGTVASFTDGTLTITLNDGSTVSGKVTLGTEIECTSTMASAADNDNRWGSDGSNSGPGSGEDQRGDSSGRDGRDDDAGDDDAHDEAEHCSPSVLVPGASVREALLSVGSAGAFWVKLEL